MVLMDTNISFDKQQASQLGPGGADRPAGIMPGLVGAGIDLAGSGVRTSLGLFDEVRGQTFALATQSIDFAESLVHGVCDLGRRSVKRLDQATGEALAAIERVATSALGAVRATTDQAARLAMTVAEGAVGSNRGEPKHN